MISKLPRRRKLATAILTLSFSALLLPSVATAQESDGWDFRVTPYLWMLGMDGTTAALGNDVPLEADFGDILDLLNMALSVNMELNNGKFFVVLDPMWADLEAPIDTGTPIGGKVEIQLVIVDALVGLSLSEHFDVYAGARYYDQDITIVPNMLPEISLGDDWTDFLLGIRAHGEMSDKWSIAGKIDAAVSGDSESAVYAQVMFLRHIGTNKHFDIGYRYYDVDYESGSGLTRFKWDVAHSGPVLGFSWEF
jgi:hypothetical protein